MGSLDRAAGRARAPCCPAHHLIAEIAALPGTTRAGLGQRQTQSGKRRNMPSFGSRGVVGGHSSKSESRRHLQDPRKECSPEGTLRSPMRDPGDSLMT